RPTLAQDAASTLRRAVLPAGGNAMEPRDARRRHAATKLRAERTTKMPYKMAQIRVCWRTVSAGSMITGYASNASRLPMLLAAYKKYGSPADRSSVEANHCCMVEAVVGRTTDAKPTAARTTGGV